MGTKRKQHSAPFKAEVVMVALAGTKTLAKLTLAPWPKRSRWRPDMRLVHGTVDLWTAGFAGSRLSARSALAHRPAPAHKLHSAQATLEWCCTLSGKP